MSHAQKTIRRNPFATRYVASARLTPRDADGVILDLAALVVRLGANAGSGAIVGAHGTGKSTLLSHLADAVAAGRRPVWRTRMSHRGDTIAVIDSIRNAPRGALVCIDSWELLGPAGRIVARWLAGRVGVGLLVTAHRETGIPTLFRCRGSRHLLGALVSQLPGYDEWFGTTIVPDDLDAAEAEAGGDMRRAFDLLYDRFEQARSSESP